MVAVRPADNLHTVLQVFQARKKHIALVTNSTDVFEECWRRLDAAARGESAAAMEASGSGQGGTPLV
eukprot:gene36673-36841_t